MSRVVKLDLSVDDWELFRYSRLVGTHYSSLDFEVIQFRLPRHHSTGVLYDKTPRSSLSFILIDHLQSPSSDKLTKALLH